MVCSCNSVCAIISNVLFSPLLFLRFCMGCKQAYDPQTGYDIPYFRPAVDEALRDQGSQEVKLN